MKQRPRIYYTEEQKALMWDRWQKGKKRGEIGNQYLWIDEVLAFILPIS